LPTDTATDIASKIVIEDEPEMCPWGAYLFRGYLFSTTGEKRPPKTGDVYLIDSAAKGWTAVKRMGDSEVDSTPRWMLEPQTRLYTADSVVYRATGEVRCAQKDEWYVPRDSLVPVMHEGSRSTHPKPVLIVKPMEGLSIITDDWSAEDEDAVSFSYQIDVNGTLVRHECNPSGRHRLVVGDKVGEWESYEGLCVNGSFRAVTQYWEGALPIIFSVTPYLLEEPLRSSYPGSEEREVPDDEGLGMTANDFTPSDER
jgi:hypothetical protein